MQHRGHSGAPRSGEPGIHNHMRPKSAFYVYILASGKHGTLYIGVTNNVVRRVYEHRQRAVPSFTSRYGVTKLVYFEIYDDPESAIAREKKIKRWRRDWKIRLIEENNPDWVDLFDGIAR